MIDTPLRLFLIIFMYLGITHLAFSQAIPEYNPRPEYYDSIKKIAQKNLLPFINYMIRENKNILPTISKQEQWKAKIQKLKGTEGFSDDMDVLINNPSATRYFSGCLIELLRIVQNEGKPDEETKVIAMMKKKVETGWSPKSKIIRCTEEQEFYKDFFNGNWAQYIINLSGSTKYYDGTPGRKLKAGTQELDSSFAKLIYNTVQRGSKLEGRKYRSLVINDWAKANVDYFVPKGIYAYMGIEWTKNKGGSYYYFSVVYRVESHEHLFLKDSLGQ
jgi:hypothetical protein